MATELKLICRENFESRVYKCILYMYKGEKLYSDGADVSLIFSFA